MRGGLKQLHSIILWRLLNGLKLEGANVLKHYVGLSMFDAVLLGVSMFDVVLLGVSTVGRIWKLLRVHPSE